MHDNETPEERKRRLWIEATQTISPDADLVERLHMMKHGFGKQDPATMLHRQVALGEMTPAHAQRVWDLYRLTYFEELSDEEQASGVRP